MHSKPQKRTAERLTCRKSWKSCLPAKTKARARMPPPFLQPSCALRSRFEAVLKGSEKAKLDAGNQRQGRRYHRREQRNRRGHVKLRTWQANGARELWLWCVALLVCPGCLP